MVKKRLGAALVAAGMLLSVAAGPADVSAKELSSARQAEQAALEKVPGAIVTDVESDTEDGVKVYEVELVKGSVQYEIVYRASDGRMLEYGWEKTSVSPNTKKPMIDKAVVKSKAEEKVKNGKIYSIFRERDDGIDIYKIRMAKGGKRFTLKYHARTGKLIEYEWELTD